MADIQVWHYKNHVTIVSYVSQRTLCLIFPMCVATMHCHTTVEIFFFFLNCSLWFWHTSDLEIGQGHQTWYELLDPEQGYDHANFQRPPLNSVHQKANIKVNVQAKTWQLSLFNMCKSEK